MTSPEAPRSRAEAEGVLRYWLASLQLTEALEARPRARRTHERAFAPRLDAPVAGQEYFKLPIDAALEALLARSRPLHKPLDAELGAFFEGWLLSHYRRGNSDERESTHLLAFPVVHLPRGELAGLLRYSVRVKFGIPGGEEFRVPTRYERRQKKYPLPPTEVRVVKAERGARQWPFFLDTRLLHQQLGVAREHIDALFDALRARSEVSEREMLAMVGELLEAELAQRDPQLDAAIAGVELGPLLERITATASGLLKRRAGRARVYPVGIVLDSTRAKTTWFLQRELQALLDERPEVAWDLGSSLGAYLTSAAVPQGGRVQRVLFPGASLSESQRLAAERCWGSRLSVIEGPPGTGKTTLILHLAAEALVRQVDALADTGAMGEGLFVVASTNNRAVDNVVDPWGALAGEGLPFALRAGSQRACEQLLLPQLGRARQWLEAARQRSATDRADALAAALQRFCGVRAELDQLQGARAHALAERTERESLSWELAQLGTVVADSGKPIDPSAVARLRAPLDRVRERLERLCGLCDTTPGLAQLTAVDRHYRSMAKKILPALADALAAEGWAVELRLPPPLPPSHDPAVLMEAWEVAADEALARLDAVREHLERSAGLARVRERAEQVRKQLALLGSGEREIPAEPEGAEALQRALFAAAVAVREAWAAEQAEVLLPAVRSALDAVQSDASLRALWNDESRAWHSLCQLFGLWGCTLLSLGNCFPAQHEAIEALVIDEAGQCHPAYAVSGLLRAQNAWLIGDVHQLEPVIDLEVDDDARLIENAKLALRGARLEPYRVHSQARNSVQSLASRAVPERPRLVDHFRCQPEIIAISDALCNYGLRVHTKRSGPSARLPFLPHPVHFVDVAGEQERAGGSWFNPAELALTVELMQQLLAAGVDPSDVAVITPYRGQLEALRRQFTRANIPLEPTLELSELEEPAHAAAVRGAALGTVHRFQGGERSIVLFTSVVTRRASLGFLDERENLLNVAVSRARHRFVALGHRSVLALGARTRLLTRAAAALDPDAFRLQRSLGLV